MIKKNILGLILSILMLAACRLPLAACGNGDVSSSGGSASGAATVTAPTTLNVNEVGTTFGADWKVNKVEFGNPAAKITVDYVFHDADGNDIAGVIRWGDGTED